MNILAERRRRYADLLAREVEARNALAEQTRLIDVGAQALHSATTEHNSAQENRDRLAASLAALESDRRAIFGLRSVDDEEQAARNRLQELEKQEEALRVRLDDASRALTRSRSDAAAIDESLTRRASDLRDMEADLEKHLAAERFADEKSCREALLSPEEMDELASERDHLAKRAAALDARQKDLARKRAEQRLPLPPRDATEQALAETRAERENALRTLGSIQERLSANAVRKSQAAELTGLLKKQADTCRRWNALNELIGSSDGKKIPQLRPGTHLPQTHHHGQPAARLHDRPLPARHSKTEALTLNVIDRYQADAVRSSRNLSGGESFIVSLALALGLAQMASRNVRVDSVFLDEGFGTLDEEALGTALDMLASLRQKGKMIGIISHVQAVRDRVSLQIQVSPLGNGKSALSGPGFSRGERQKRQERHAGEIIPPAPPCFRRRLRHSAGRGARRQRAFAETAGVRKGRDCEGWLPGWGGSGRGLSGRCALSRPPAVADTDSGHAGISVRRRKGFPDVEGRIEGRFAHADRENPLSTLWGTRATSGIRPTAGKQPDSLPASSAAAVQVVQVVTCELRKRDAAKAGRSSNV